MMTMMTFAFSYYSLAVSHLIRAASDFVLHWRHVNVLLLMGDIGARSQKTALRPCPAAEAINIMFPVKPARGRLPTSRHSRSRQRLRPLIGKRKYVLQINISKRVIIEWDQSVFTHLSCHSGTLHREVVYRLCSIAGVLKMWVAKF